MEITERHHRNYPVDCITLYDGERRIAVARRSRSGRGWIVTGQRLGWIDKGDRINAFGISQPQYLNLRSITQVRELFGSMTKGA